MLRIVRAALCILLSCPASRGRSTRPASDTSWRSRHRGQTAFAGCRGRRDGHRHGHADEHASPGSTRARRSDRSRRDRGEGVDDAGQRRDAAGRNNRAARADDLAGARRGQCAHSGAPRPVLAARRGRSSAVRRAGRFIQPAPGASTRSRASGDHQRRRLRALRSVGARRRDQSRVAPAGRGRARAADQRHVAIGS